MAVGKARQATRQATRVKIAFNRLGSERLAVGTPDPGQPANLRDDVEHYVTPRHRAGRVSYHVPKQTSSLIRDWDQKIKEH